MGEMKVDCCTLCSTGVLFAEVPRSHTAAIYGCLAGISSAERCGVADLLKGFCPEHWKLYQEACAYADSKTGFEKAS